MKTNFCVTAARIPIRSSGIMLNWKKSARAYTPIFNRKINIVKRTI